MARDYDVIADDAPADDDIFTLFDGVGPRRRNRRADVLKVETLLANAGHHDLQDGPTGYAGSGLDQAIRAYQKRRNLTVDGVLEPGGETITTLDGELRPRFRGFRAPRPDEADEHFNRVGRGEEPLFPVAPRPPVLHDIPDLPEIDGGAWQSNGRTARALLQTRDNGPLADLVARAIESDGVAGVAEVRDLLDQIRARDPKRADTMARAVFDRLEPKNRLLFTGGDQPKGEPIGVMPAERSQDANEEKESAANNDSDAESETPDGARSEPDRSAGDQIAQAGNAPASRPASGRRSAPSLPVPLLEPPVRELRPRIGDPTGSGRYGSARQKKDGSPRAHAGVDIEVEPGKPVIAPITGRIKFRGDAYRKDENGRDVNLGLRTVTIEGTGEFAGMEVKILYVEPNALPKGAQVQAGKTVIGSSQDARVSPRNPAAMHPHIHVEVNHNGRQIDPTPLLFPSWP